MGCLAEVGGLGDSAGMIVFAGPILAAVISVSTPRPVYGSSRYHHRVPRQTEAALQSRILKMTRLAILVRREALLHDYLVRANTETPVFHDETTYRLDPGILVRATRVTVDFIGSPIVRARVSNLTSLTQTVLMQALLASIDGASAQAAVVVTLQPFETRTIEMLCPSRIVPASLMWSATPL